MASPTESIQHVERRLARFEALERMLVEINEELTAYREVLDRKLLLLQSRTEAAALPQDDRQEVAAPTVKELRTAPRRKGNPVSVLLADFSAATEPFQGWVLDRSGGGLGILLDEAIPIDTVLSIRPVKSSPGFPWMEVKVCSCQPERGGFRVGLQFTGKHGWGELRAFG